VRAGGHLRRYQEGHYDVQDVEFGKVYRWCPESVVIECVCGEELTLTSSKFTCECGADYANVVREELTFRQPEDEAALHPWRFWHSSEEGGIPF
jgi:hypothetical protein